MANWWEALGRTCPAPWEAAACRKEYSIEILTECSVVDIAIVDLAVVNIGKYYEQSLDNSVCVENA